MFCIVIPDYYFFFFIFAREVVLVVTFVAVTVVLAVFLVIPHVLFVALDIVAMVGVGAIR